jgi:hypothetical protein
LRGTKAALSAFGVVLSFLGCDNDYPIAPTPCDDWCLATQRANCKEDWPEKCVSGCAFDWGPSTEAACYDTFQALLACYARADDSDFFCRGGYSTPADSVCEEERDRDQRCRWASESGCTSFCNGILETCEDIVECPLNCESSACGEAGQNVVRCLWQSRDVCGTLMTNGCHDERTTYAHCVADAG